MNLNKLPFQEEIGAIDSQCAELLAIVNPQSDLADALWRVRAILEPHFGNVEWQEPISTKEMADFRRILQGMAL